MSLTKQIIDAAIKRFEVLEGLFTKDKYTVDRITNIDDSEVDDMSYLHIQHDFLLKNWGYESPVEGYLERKKNLRISKDAMGFIKGIEVLKGEIETEDKKNNWDKLMGVG